MSDPPSLFDPPEPDLPVRPYTQNGRPSAGYARTSAPSRAAEPIRAGNQRAVYNLLASRGRHGMTGHEANEAIGKPTLTTGQAALSTMHKTGHVLRLKETRNEQGVYVVPEFQDGRPLDDRGRHGATSCWNCGVDL